MNKIDSMNDRSVNGKNISVTRKNKTIKKEKHKKLVRNLLVLAATFCIGSQAVYGINQENEIKKELNSSNEFMRTKIVYYLEKSDLDYSILEDEIHFENDEEKLSDFVGYLYEDGFSKNEILYIISKVGGKKDVDNIAKYYGYDNYNEFIEKFKPGSIVDTKEEFFEKLIREEYIETVDEIKESEESKGIKR